MTYLELQQLTASYLHRSDLTVEITEFIELARQRINRDMRTREMIVQETSIPTINPFLLPDGWLEMRDLYHQPDGRRQRVIMASRAQIDLFATSTIAQVRPKFYSIDGLFIETKPGGIDVEFEFIFYKAVPVLVNDADTHPTLDVYNNIWLNATLWAGHTFTQDMDLAANALSEYVGEMEGANGASKSSESGAGLQMQGASVWV